MIREGKDRILSSLHALEIELPRQRILINLLPGDQPKEGSHFDLPILVALFQAMGLLPKPQGRAYYWGELQLDGCLRPFPDAIRHLFSIQSPLAESYHFSPMGVWDEEVEDFLHGKVFLMEHVEELFRQILPKALPMGEIKKIEARPPPRLPDNCLWNQLRGSRQQFLTWALALSGREHLLLMGSPGQGKSLWSKAAKDLLPPLAVEDWKDRVRFSGSDFRATHWRDLEKSPFEAPHHKASASAVVGGGSRQLKAGAMTRAHRGILFMDEFLEFHRDVLESLREPLEEKALSIARQQQSLRLPADIQLVAATNPCPCGNFRSLKVCVCRTQDFERYQRKLSGPLLDRFHRKLWWEYEDEKTEPEFKANPLRERIAAARRRQLPKIDALKWPPLENPRQERLFLDKWKTWLRWHSPSEATQQNFEEFWEFETEWERRWKGEQPKRTVRVRGTTGFH
jgi:magnesium chelatase family protein